LQGLYPQYHCEMMIKYDDKENDRIAVTCQLEWEEMMEELADEKIIKLYIEEGPNPKGYFKDGPEPEALHFYTNEVSKEPIGDDTRTEEFKWSIPKCLESLFRDHRIIPSNIPTFLRDAIKLNYKRPEEVDLDVDIPLLFDLLHKKALECLSSIDKEVIQKGKDYLISMVQMKPDNYIALYNLACAESLLNRIPESLQTLEQAIRSGYRNLEHMLEDADLDNIRNSEGFINLISLISDLGDHFVDSQQVFNEEVCEDGNYCCEDSNFCCQDSNYCCQGDNLSNEPVVLEYDSTIVDELDNQFNTHHKEIQQLNNNLSESFIDLRTKWTAQINDIKSLGFTIDDEVLSLLLEQTNGNVQDVANLLLQTSKSL